MISIIMPAYNCESYIQLAIESVIKQTYLCWELIIIDDHSVDNTWTILQKIVKKDSRIHIFQNKNNLGVAATRNLGVKLAKGDWIAFLDSDDLWVPKKLEKQIILLDKHADAVLLYTGSAFIDEQGNCKRYTLSVPEYVTYKELLKQNIISCSSVLVQKKYLQKCPMPEINNLHEDFVVWLCILREISFAYGVNEPLLIYRLSSKSKSGNKWKSARMNWLTYRYIDVPFKTMVISMFFYAVRSIFKYLKIWC